MEDLSKIRKMVDAMCGYLENVGRIFKSACKDPSVQKYDFAKGARMDIFTFLLYLSASDGQFEWEEAIAIAKMCGYQLTPEQLKSLISGINIQKFVSKEPLSFYFTVYADKIMGKKANDAFCNLLIQTYRDAGDALIKSDGVVDDNECRDLFTYIRMLENYRNNVLGGQSTSASAGFVKE